MPIVAVEYTYSEATAAARDEIRPDHRAWLSGLVERGAVLTTGPFADGSGALILATAEDVAAVRSLFTNDPFAKAGLVEAARFTEWTPVMGAFS
ncbi:YCII-related domain protein [Rhodococcus sp. MTM3W5.2]|uniref:YciI family protein n=1 Tax=Rhodococcus sp. MTM3W5.2 TaxID=1805827 RepID=UPI0009795B29|nr:YciI family protein [Rhodococcus sp. MTM3W5.2]AQA26034.1 YCII-related domain protein [Rhodococcus sp. MTM3W5.2]